ncbi:UNVERIFIED_CONTAM: hypothetical protein H355_004840 [Colinus virginianus]|nr:hypothetical protein H355_004840 [Colinus virginianus]
MRDAMKRLGGEPQQINPLVDVDLVIDHSVQVDYSRTPEAFQLNLAAEMKRNAERFAFLKWGSRAFSNMLIVPPGSGIVHQVNLEYLARVVMQQQPQQQQQRGGSSSSGGGREEGAGEETDVLVATMGFFPVDTQTLDYLRATGREPEKVALVEQYTRANGLFAGPPAPAEGREAEERNRGRQNAAASSSTSPPLGAGHESVIFSDRCSLDLSSLQPCVAGPKRPQDRVPLSQVREDFSAALTAPVGFKGYGLAAAEPQREVVMHYRDGQTYRLRHGSVVIAAITSCTNTSNPGVILGAGLLAKKAVERGLTVAPYIVTTLSPGSKAVTDYLEKSGLLQELEKLRFFTAGYGCMTCIGNTGEFDKELAAAITQGDLVVAAVLSGNRNFEGRVHPLTRANYLASPPLVVAYALAGRVDIDFDKEPLGKDKNGMDVFLKDIWPTRHYPGLWNNLRLYPAVGTYLQLDISSLPLLLPSSSSSSVAQVMVRGTFANIRLVNKMCPKDGPKAVHVPSGDVLPVYDVAMRYMHQEQRPLIILAGKEYGSGSSRDWAAK